MRTLAIAIELVEDMTTDSFLNALSRVIYTRRRIIKPNFVGAANKLERLHEIWEEAQMSPEWKRRGIE